MRDGFDEGIAGLAERCRMVAAMLIAGLWRGRTAPEIAARIEGLSPRGQVGVIGGVLGTMFLLSLFSAQFGLAGIALYLAAVVIVVA